MSRPLPSTLRLRACLSWLLVGWLVLSCGSSPTPRFWSIHSMEDEADAHEVRRLAVAVGPVTIPRYLQRPQIVVRSGDSSLVYREFDRWGGTLESEILRVLGEDLGALLGTDRIVVYPRQAAFSTDYRVRVDFERLEGVGGGELLLKARWVVVAGGGGDALAVETTTLREKLDGPSVQELVRAHGSALAALSRTIAERIETLEAAGEDSGGLSAGAAPP